MATRWLRGGFRVAVPGFRRSLIGLGYCGTEIYALTKRHSGLSCARDVLAGTGRLAALFPITPPKR